MRDHAPITAIELVSPNDQNVAPDELSRVRNEVALSFDGEFNLRGITRVRADARSPLAIIAVAFIIVIIVAGAVLIAR